MKHICCRCKNLKEDFTTKNNKRLKTCDKCRADKKRYSHTVIGKKVNLEAGRRWRLTDSGKEITKQINIKQHKKYPKKYKARYRTAYLIKKGILLKEPCFICNFLNVEAHHLNYSQFNKVMWLCRSCHSIIHQRGGQYSIHSKKD
jgi:hypothetical protein